MFLVPPSYGVTLDFIFIEVRNPVAAYARDMSDRLHIHWSGLSDRDAPTLVLLHGITNSGAGWPDAVSRWAGTYRIAAIDALGHGSV